jgi:glycosyltransferase involved in cell wall biosynthesis
MPVYNSARFLRESIGSVLGQTFRDFELIAVDDRSTDESWEVLQTIRDKRVRSFRCKQNFGVAKARNYAVQQADCEYLAFLDADDCAHASRLEIEVASLDARRDIGAAASRAMIVRPGGKSRQQPRERFRPEEISAILLFRNCIVQSSVLMRRQCWKLYRPEFELAEDYDLWARFVPENSFLLLDDVLVTYRDHQGGLSCRFPEKMRNAVREIHRFQLERLGVTPREELHGRLSTWPASATAADLAEAESWLLILLAANRIYDPESLKRTIERIWFSVCLDSWSLGPQAFRIYRRSRLGRMTSSRLWQFVRRFGKRALLR